MSFIRRVKSFSVKKSKSTDELKAIGEDKRYPYHHRARKRNNLSKEKSLSMEFVPLRIDLEKNDLFIKQKSKLEKYESANRTRESRPVTELPRRKILEKRESRSLDEINFFQCVSENCSKNLWPSMIQLRSMPSRDRGSSNRSRFNTVDVTRVSILEIIDRCRRSFAIFVRSRQKVMNNNNRENGAVRRSVTGLCFNHFSSSVIIVVIISTMI
ncbi:hypothetical protein BDFB_005882 [Asbolus verrucosus]|uniref:Uncharacterized protein n=1 Tax=Asbolus verrucosus TaxID=1661398 RepID=A0A482W8W8_ASBVE|nr:hypothetical protein BDFB_005882 [Asbolus verrucosus]